MKAHRNYIFIQINFYDVIFVYNIIQTSSFFFFLEKSSNFYEQSSLHVLLAVGAYWNHWAWQRRLSPWFSFCLKFHSFII